MKAAKLALSLVLALLLCGTAFGLSASLDKQGYKKGEALRIEGEGSGNISIEIQNEGRTVLEASTKEDSFGKFAFDYNISFLDPSGQWQIVIRDDANASQRLKTTVSQSRESLFLSVVFLSPAPTNFQRLSKIPISVVVKDSGKPENRASVYFWDAKGKKTELEFKGNGNYSADYEIPRDANVGPFTLKAVAAKKNEFEKELAGGESTVQTTIMHAQLSIATLEPLTKNYSFGEPVRFIFRPSYQNGNPLTDGNAIIIIGEEIFNLEADSEHEYSKTVKTENISGEVLNVEARFSDAFGNEASEKISLQAIDYWIWFLKKNILLLLIPMMFAAYVMLVFGRQIKAFLRKRSLEHRKKQLETMLLKLQDDYYNKAVLTPGQFKELEAKYSSELEKAHAKLRKISEEELV